MNIVDFPQELIIEQLKLLSLKGVLIFSEINHQFIQICKSEMLWQTLLMRDYPSVSSVKVDDFKTAYIAMNRIRRIIDWSYKLVRNTRYGSQGVEFL